MYVRWQTHAWDWPPPSVPLVEIRVPGVAWLRICLWTDPSHPSGCSLQVACYVQPLSTVWSFYLCHINRDTVTVAHGSNVCGANCGFYGQSWKWLIQVCQATNYKCLCSSHHWGNNINYQSKWLYPSTKHLTQYLTDYTSQITAFCFYTYVHIRSLSLLYFHKHVKM